MKPRWSPEEPEEIIFSVCWVIMGPIKGVTSVYGTCVPSKSTTKTSREERFWRTLKRTAQYRLRTQRMKALRIKATEQSAIL